MKTDIAIATPSWVRTPAESQVVIETITAYGALGIPVVVVDGGSPAAEQDKIKNISNVLWFEAKGLNEQLRVAHEEAQKVADHIFYTHSDKLDFAQHEARKLMDYYRQLPNKGILIPTRTPGSFATYPEYQQKAEEFLSWFIGDYLKHHADYYAGPTIYPAQLVDYLPQLTGDIGWGIEAYFYVLAKRLNLPFDFISVDFKAPANIEDDETTNNYRIKIVAQQIEAFLQGQKVS
jgi:hypothetical protein